MLRISSKLHGRDFRVADEVLAERQSSGPIVPSDVAGVVRGTLETSVFPSPGGPCCVSNGYAIAATLSLE